MKRIGLLLVLCIVQGIGKGNAQVMLQYTDSAVNPGSTITLGVNYQPPMTLTADDQFSDKVNIGFPFTYFGTVYNQCVVSGNNFISFDTLLANTIGDFVYASAVNSGNLNHAILFPFQDLELSMAGHLSYIRTGTAPNRKFVVSFCKTPIYSCDTTRFTDQLILNETSNSIEMHITSKTTNCTWQGGTAVQGVKNGSTQVYVQGRDQPNVQWAASNEGKLFTPSGINNYTITTIPFNPLRTLDSAHAAQLKWYDENNMLLGQGLTQVVTPGINTHYYTVRYNGIVDCDSPYTFTDTVHIQALVTTGINKVQNEDNNILAYPNPAKNYLIVECKNDSKLASLLLFDILGHPVYSEKLIAGNNKYSISLKDLSSGFYYLQAATDKGIIRKKIEVVHP